MRGLVGCRTEVGFAIIHGASIMAIYVFDKSSGEMVEKGARQRSNHHQVMSDLTPYRSMIDGSVISSRSTHRTHLRDHGCIEVGNETMENVKPSYKSDARKRMIADQLWNVSDRDANRILNQFRKG